MTPAPRPAAYWDGWYAAQSAAPSVSEIQDRAMGFPPGTRAGVLAAAAVPELARELRLRPGDVLADVACGRGAYGILIAKATGARLSGVDISAQAVAEATEQAARLGVPGAAYQVGDLTATGLPGAGCDAVLCADAVQFAAGPGAAYAELYRVLRPGGRVALTCWEPLDPADERVPERIRAVRLADGLRDAGFTDVQAHARPSWLAAERALWEEAARIDPAGDPALKSFHGEAVRSLQFGPLLRRVLAVATRPA